jgi:hypothetical protein
MNKVAMAIVIATVLVSCNSPSDVVKSTSLREEVINAGPERLIATLQSYPQTNGEMIRTKGDHQFLVEISRGTVTQPAWLNASASSYTRAKELAIYYLAIDHQNEHYRLAPSDLANIRQIAREKLSDPHVTQMAKLETIGALSAVGEASDVGLIEEFGAQSNDSQSIRRVVMSLALMCDPAAGDAMTRVISAKNSFLTDEFRSRAAEVREGKQRTMCKSG